MTSSLLTTAELVQLCLFDDQAREGRLADQLVDRRRMPSTGPARLLEALVQRELEPAALPAAALLVVALDDQARADSRIGR